MDKITSINWISSPQKNRHDSNTLNFRFNLPPVNCSTLNQFKVQPMSMYQNNVSPYYCSNILAKYFFFNCSRCFNFWKNKFGVK